MLGLLPSLGRSAMAQAAPGDWRHRVVPYITFLAGDRPAVGAAISFWRPSDSTARTPESRSIELAAGIGLRGGARLEGRWATPAGRPFRFAVEGDGSWQERTFFPGIGNEVPFDPSFERRVQPDYYSVMWDRTWARADVTRWLGPALALAAGLGIDRASYRALSGPSVFGDRYGARREERDVTAGITVIYDRRNLERMAGRGVLVEAGAVTGRAYQRAFGLVQAYLPIGRGVVYAIRAVGSSMSAAAPLVARLQVPAWETQLEVLGGNESIRGLQGGRYTGRGVLFLNQEIRRDLGRIRGVPIVGIGFVDVGRVFEAERFRITTDGLKSAGGIGLSARGNREWMGSALVAVGPDGLRASVMSGWAF